MITQTTNLNATTAAMRTLHQSAMRLSAHRFSSAMENHPMQSNFQNEPGEPEATD